MAWLLGGLQALVEETGWDPADADQLVGTSAGSIVAPLVAAQRPFAVDPPAGAEGDGSDSAPWPRTPWPPEELRDLRVTRLHRGLPRPGLGSWRLAVSTSLRPDRHTPLALYSAWLPTGIFSTGPVRQMICRLVPDGWDAHPNLWIVACDYDTGRRVVFGREGSPPAELADAVCASCSIPGSYAPVKINGRRYVDGGMYSTSNLDVVRDCGLDLAICLNPTSTLHPPAAWNPLERVANVLRSESGRRLGRERRKLRERGTEVLLVQPTDFDLEAMGHNLMSSNRDRHRRVRELARRTVAEQLRTAASRELLAELREGRRPGTESAGSGAPSRPPPERRAPAGSLP